ncbi:MAG TPA: IgGFc-binding protein, partial [Patescibacteria group bacterium]|nr:IgGFc-binding protein [Patescibacteria group bacterium]
MKNSFLKNRLSSLIFGLLSTCTMFLFSTQDAFAQDIRDSKGKVFWLTFLPNFHNNPGALEDSLYIFITAEQPASGTIQYYDRMGVPYQTQFSIGKDEFFIFSKVYRDFELYGFNSPNSMSPTGSNQNEITARQVFKITSSTDVTVYGLNQALTTSDAFIALPEDVLGEQYMIMSYPTDGDTPSQFAIVATRNNTSVKITPKAPTSRSNSNAEQNIILNAGEAYLVQTRIGQGDLTGSKIESNEPIAVFAGHQRAKIPNPSTLASRDHLVEQLPPIPTWGGSAFVTPYPLAFGANQNDFDVYRILAANNDTKIYIDGVFNRTLNSGQFYDTRLEKSEWITATGPILVAQFKKSSNEVTGDGRTGDPFMIINSPTEQYLKRFHCFNVKAWQRDFQTPTPVYDNEQYLTIIVPTDSVATVWLDGNLLSPSLFKKLSITSYSYTDSLKVSTGVHTVESNAKMGVYVYGYGEANSYGYIGGMGYDTIYTFDPPDIIPPLILGNAVCGIFTGKVADTLSFDRGIQNIEVITSGVDNATVMINPLVPPARSIPFTAALIDPYADGRISLKAIDSSNGSREAQFDIPGFTVRSILSDGTQLPQYSETTKFKENKCITIEISNYGKFNQTISSVSF